jgi:hypothetical protein
LNQESSEAKPSEIGDNDKYSDGDSEPVSKTVTKNSMLVRLVQEQTLLIRLLQSTKKADQDMIDLQLDIIAIIKKKLGLED